MNCKNKVAEGLLDLVIKRYSSRLDPQGLEEVRKGVEVIAEAVIAMRNMKLEYSDEPHVVFKPYEKED